MTSSTQVTPTIVTTRGASAVSTATKTTRPKPRILLTLILAVLAVLWLLPVLGLLITSFRSTTDAQATGWWAVFGNLGHAFNLDNYANALSGSTSGTGTSLSSEFLNSIAIVLPATILPLMFAAYAAYAFTFLEFRFKEAYFAIIVGLLVVPVQVALVPVLQTYKAIESATGIQIQGSIPSVWIVHSAFALPLCIFILRNYMSTLPNALIEAARIDGASHYQIFWRLVVPMSIPALASFAIFQFIWVWNDYLVSYIFAGNSYPSLQVGLYALLGQYAQGWNLVAAGSFVVMIIPLIVFFSLQRFFVRGLTAGSVK